MKQIRIVILSLLFGLSTIGLKAQVIITEEHQDFTPEAYWQDVDFNDTALIHAASFDDMMVDFLYRFTCSNQEGFDTQSYFGVSFLLEKAKVNMRVYEYVLEFLLNGYSNMGKSQIVDYLLTYPMLFEGEISMEEGSRLDSITEPYQKVKVGAKAPDLSGVTIEGKPYHLYESTAKNILVVFWSTDCEYCHDFLTEIRKHLNLKSDYELVTFALADSQEEVAEAVKKLRLRGYHFYDPLRWESKPFLDYHVTSTPTVFLLDEEKNIVCKPYDWSELKLYVKRNK